MLTLYSISCYRKVGLAHLNTNFRMSARPCWKLIFLPLELRFKFCAHISNHDRPYGRMYSPQISHGFPNTNQPNKKHPIQCRKLCTLGARGYLFFLTSEAIDIHSCNTLRGLWNQGGSCVNGPILEKWFSRALSAIVFDKREDFRFLSRHFRKFPNLNFAIRSIYRFKVLTLGRAT